jgi:hypothetical protein
MIERSDPMDIGHCVNYGRVAAHGTIQVPLCCLLSCRLHEDQSGLLLERFCDEGQAAEATAEERKLLSYSVRYAAAAAAAATPAHHSSGTKSGP